MNCVKDEGALCGEQLRVVDADLATCNKMCVLCICIKLRRFTQLSTNW